LAVVTPHRRKGKQAHRGLEIPRSPLSKKDQPPKMMMREEFQRLAELRAEEAAVLADNGKEQGAYYLAGLAVECALKACIAKRTKQHQYPPKNTGQYYEHNLDVLLKLAELQHELDGELSRSPGFATNWGTVHNWNVDKRYEVTNLRGTEMVAAVNSADGVLQWLKQRW